jgi:hypothetical protein
MGLLGLTIVMTHITLDVDKLVIIDTIARSVEEKMAFSQGSLQGKPYVSVCMWCRISVLRTCSGEGVPSHQRPQDRARLCRIACGTRRFQPTSTTQLPETITPASCLTLAIPHKQAPFSPIPIPRRFCCNAEKLLCIAMESHRVPPCDSCPRPISA